VTRGFSFSLHNWRDPSTSPYRKLHSYFALSSFTCRCFPNTNDLAVVHQRAEPATAQVYNVTQTWRHRVVQNDLLLHDSHFWMFFWQINCLQSWFCSTMGGFQSRLGKNNSKPSFLPLSGIESLSFSKAIWTVPRNISASCINGLRNLMQNIK
jgi:hypothetical protein